jgi:pimeloyl-ACP methyl ester carboxylesterase
MKRIIAIAWLVLCIMSIPLPAQIGILRSDSRKLSPRLQSKASIRTASPSIHWHKLAQNVAWSQCPPEAEDRGASCGHVWVPLDRLRPHRNEIGIYFEVYGHSNPGPAESAILINFGGPGSGTTTNRDLALLLFTPNLDAHDLLLIDDRGRGLSNTIDCEELQHGTAPPLQHEIADCADQLGSEASRFGTGDIAQDTDAVRAALGMTKSITSGGPTEVRM